MSAILRSVQAFATEVGAALTSHNPAKILQGLGSAAKIGLVATNKIDDSLTYPKASILGAIINFTVGKRDSIVIAAKAVAIAKHSLQLSHEGTLAKEAFKRLIGCFAGRFPLPFTHLRNLETYEHHPSKNGLEVTLICKSPKFVSKSYLETKRVLQATKSLLCHSTLAGISAVEIGLSLFFKDPLTQFDEVTALPVNAVKIYERLKDNPEPLIKLVNLHADGVNKFLRFVGLPLDEKKLTANLQKGMKKVSDHAPKIQTVVQVAQHASFYLINLTTDLRVAPFGASLPEQSQPHMLLEYYNGRACYSDPTGKTKAKLAGKRYCNSFE